VDRPFKPKISAESVQQFRRQSTPTEETLWKELRNRRLAGAKFRRQHRIGAFVVDFCCSEHRLVIEVDGLVHLRTPVQDMQRQEWIEGEGYRVLRIPSHGVEENLAALKRIELALQPSPPQT
jgi:very-short-patch-repair endonuclease